MGGSASGGPPSPPLLLHHLCRPRRISGSIGCSFGSPYGMVGTCPPTRRNRVNWADPLEGAASGYGYNWPVPSADGDATWMRESGSSLAGTLSSGGVALTSPPEMVKLTGLASSAATGTVTSN